MKKYFILFLFVLFFAVPAMAIDYQATVEFEQATADLPNLDHWVLQIRSVKAEDGGPVESKIDIPYDGSPGPSFTHEEIMADIVGHPGGTITKYATLVAVSKNGSASKESNEAAMVFEIPYDDVTTPIKLTITIRVTP